MNGGPSAFNSPFATRKPFTQHPPTRQPPLRFIDIALKLGAQLSISTAIFQVFGMTRLRFELTTSRSSEKCSTFTLPVDQSMQSSLKFKFHLKKLIFTIIICLPRLKLCSTISIIENNLTSLVIVVTILYRNSN